MEGINIPIGADVDPLKSDLTKAVKIIDNASQQFVDAAQRAAGKAKGGTDAIMASSMSLQQKFRALQKEAFTLGDRYGVMSTQALAASKAAGELKKELDDARIAVKILSDDTPAFTAMSQTLQGVAGAASVVTGAMGLLGTQSEETQKMILKVQSALAITQGLASLNQLNDSFAALRVVISTSVIPAIKSLDMATKATLIGAIAGAAVIIGSYIIQMNEAAEATEKLAAAQENAKKNLDDYNAAVKSSYDANASVRKLEIEAMKEGAAKDKALLNEKILALQQEVKERWNASEQTIYDSKRKAQAEIAIEKIKQNELAEIRKKYAPKASTKKSDLVTTVSIDAKKGVDSMRIGMEKLSENVSRFVKPVEIRGAPVFDTSAWDKLKMQMGDQLEALSNTFINGFANMGSSAAYALGQALAGAGDLGQSIKAQLAGLMQQIGTAMIAMGIAYKTTGIGAAYGAVLVGSGIALNIAAGALSASAGSGSSSVGGSSVSAGNPNLGNGFGGGMGGGNFNDLTSRLYGRDLILSTERTSQYNRRG